GVTGKVVDLTQDLPWQGWAVGEGGLERGPRPGHVAERAGDVRVALGEGADGPLAGGAPGCGVQGLVAEVDTPAAGGVDVARGDGVVRRPAGGSAGAAAAPGTRADGRLVVCGAAAGPAWVGI